MGQQKCSQRRCIRGHRGNWKTYSLLDVLSTSSSHKVYLRHVSMLDINGNYISQNGKYLNGEGLTCSGNSGIYGVGRRKLDGKVLLLKTADFSVNFRCAPCKGNIFS